MPETTFNKLQVQELSELMDGNKRRKDAEPVNLAEIMKLFITESEQKVREIKDKWQPFYEQAARAMNESQFPPGSYTDAYLKELLDCRMRGGIIFIKCNDSLTRFELSYYRAYILEAINKISKTKIDKLILI